MMKDEWRMKNDEEWRMMMDEWMKNDEGWIMMISSCWGVLLTDGQTEKRTDICDCRVDFATENLG